MVKNKILYIVKITGVIICLFFSLCFISVSVLLLSEDQRSIPGAIIAFVFGLLPSYFVYKLVKSIKKRRHPEFDSDLVPHYEINSPGTPQEIIDQLKETYDAAHIPNILRVLDESKSIVMRSKNIDTVFERLELGAQKSYLLEQLEESGLYSQYPTSKEYKEFFIDTKEEMIIHCIRNSYDELLKKADELKTVQGKVKRYNTFLKLLHKYDDDYGPDAKYIVEEIGNRIKERIEELKANKP